MKHFCFKIGIFISLIVVLFLLANRYTAKYIKEPVHYGRQFDEVINKTFNADGIIIGTSHGAHSFRPTLLDSTGIRFYNFCLNGSNPSYYLKWYESFFSKEYADPKYIIYALDFFAFDQNYCNREFEDDSKYIPNSLFWEYIGSPSKFQVRKLLLNRYPIIGSIKKLKLQGKDTDITYPPSEYDRGYIPLYFPYKPSNFKPDISPATLVTLTSKMEDFEKLIKIIQARGIKLIFVMPPNYGISKNEYLSCSSIKYLNSVSGKYKIPFLNFDTELWSPLNEDINNFSDWGHLNRTGSAKFNKILQEKLPPIINNSL